MTDRKTHTKIRFSELRGPGMHVMHASMSKFALRWRIPARDCGPQQAVRLRRCLHGLLSVLLGKHIARQAYLSKITHINAHIYMAGHTHTYTHTGAHSNSKFQHPLC